MGVARERGHKEDMSLSGLTSCSWETWLLHKIKVFDLSQMRILLQPGWHTIDAKVSLAYTDHYRQHKFK